MTDTRDLLFLSLTQCLIGLVGHGTCSCLLWAREFHCSIQITSSCFITCCLCCIVQKKHQPYRTTRPNSRMRSNVYGLSSVLVYFPIWYCQVDSEERCPYEEWLGYYLDHWRRWTKRGMVMVNHSDTAVGHWLYFVWIHFDITGDHSLVGIRKCDWGINSMKQLSSICCCWLQFVCWYETCCSSVEYYWCYQSWKTSFLLVHGRGLHGGCH
jgi:hypothetical protein